MGTGQQQQIEDRPQGQRRAATYSGSTYSGAHFSLYFT